MIQPNPTFDFPIADAYLYKKFEWGESITLKLSDWGEKIEILILLLKIQILRI